MACMSPSNEYGYSVYVLMKIDFMSLCTFTLYLKSQVVADSTTIAIFVLHIYC